MTAHRTTLKIAAMLLLWLLTGCADDDQQQTGAEQGESQQQGGMTTAQGSANQQQAQQELPETTISGMQRQPVENIKLGTDLNRKIVFQLSTPSSRDSDVPRYGIWTMNANGSDLKQLTGTTEDSNYSYEGPARSPDLKKIVFTRLRQEPRVSESLVEGKSAIPYTLVVPYVFVMNADGSDQIQLVDGVGTKPDWSPDGKQVVFSSDQMWSSLGMSEDSDCDLYVASADGSGTPRRLTDEPGCESDPAWSPDGTKIAFTSNRGGNLDVYVVVVCCEENGTNLPRQLTDDSLDDTDPAWSPDGSKIAFTRSQDDVAGLSRMDADVYKMDADGSGKTRLTYSQAMEAQPTWSPDGTKIAFTRQGLPGAYTESSTGSTTLQATTGIFTMDSDGTDPAIVKIFENQIASFPEWGVTAQQDKIADQAIEGENAEQAIADWQAFDARASDTAVQAYIEQMKHLEKELRASAVDSEVQTLAQERTETVLQGLDPSGKEKVVRFLADAELVQSSHPAWTNSTASALVPGPVTPPPIIDLSSFDLRATDLSDVNLSGAYLNQVDLRGANLSRANLSRAELRLINLSGANLSGADLHGAYLIDATLEGANLEGANLEGARLESANLEGARGVVEQELEGQGAALDRAIMPDGSQHPPCTMKPSVPCSDS